jgi:hypothetical protein
MSTPTTDAYRLNKIEISLATGTEKMLVKHLYGMGCPCDRDTIKMFLGRHVLEDPCQLTQDQVNCITAKLSNNC